MPTSEAPSSLAEEGRASPGGRTGVSLPRLVVWLAAAAVLVAALARLVPVVRDHLAAPFDLISEGPHLSTIKEIRGGLNIYDPATVLDLPFHASPYTPLYHWLVAHLPQRATNPFFTGRVVAMLFMAGAAASLFAVGRRNALPAATLALGCFLLLHPVTGNTAYLRSDSTALFFSVWAVVSAARARTTGLGGVAAGVLAASAVAGKQSFYAAGAACTLFFALYRRRPLAFLASAAATTVLFALAATLRWGTGFWFCTTLPLTDYPRDWESFFVHWRMMFAQPIFVLLVVVAVGLLVTTLWRAPRALVRSPYVPYMAFSWVGQTLLMSGIGAENHNLIEPVLATLLWILATIEEGEVLSFDRRAAHTAVAVVLCAVVACVAIELRNPRWRDYAYTTPAHTEAYVRNRQDISRALTELGVAGGQALNIKNSQIAHDFDLRINVNDPWMYITVLWNSRPETEQRLARAIEAQYFDAVLTSPGVVSAAGQTTVNASQRLIRTIFRHYRLAVHGREVNVLTRIPGAAAGPER